MCEIEILFDNSKLEYFPGSTISGSVIIPTIKLQQLCQISIKLLKEIATTFYPAKNAVNHLFGNKLVCALTEKILLNSNSNETLTNIFTSLSFSFTLSERCPPTIKEIGGNISYQIIVEKITKPSQWSTLKSVFGLKSSMNDKTTKEITILPLPIYSFLMPQLGEEKAQTQLCDRYRITASIPRSLFSCGGIILITIKISDSNEREVAAIKSVLKKVTFCSGRSSDVNDQAHYLTKSLITDIKSVENRIILRPNQTLTTFNQYIDIPNDIFPSFNDDTIIEIEYIVKVKITLENLVRETQFSFLIFISIKGTAENALSNNLAAPTVTAFAPVTTSLTTRDIAPLTLPASNSTSSTNPPSYVITVPTNLDPPPSYLEAISQF